MVTELVITLLTEPTDRDIVKSHLLFSFINIGQRVRIYSLNTSSESLCPRRLDCLHSD